MAIERLESAHLLTVSPSPITPQMQMASYAARLANAQAGASGGIRAQAEWQPEGAANLRLLGKGVGWALGIEGATALCLYAMWLLWHLRV
jgi:hypothetical protein